MKKRDLAETAFPAYMRLPEGRCRLPDAGDALRDVVAAPLRPWFNPIHTPMGLPDLRKPSPVSRPSGTCPAPDLAKARQTLLQAGSSALQHAARLTNDDHEVTELQRILMQNAAGSRMVAGINDLHVQADANKWTVKEDHTTISGYRGAASLTQNVDGTNIGGFVDPYTPGATVGGVLATSCDSVLRGSCTLFASPALVGAAGNMNWTLASGAMLGVGVAAFVVGVSDFQVLGPYKGDDASLQGHQLVDFARKVVPGFGLDLYGGAHTFALGGRLMLSRGHVAHCRLHMSQDALRTLLRSRDTRFVTLRDLAQGLGLTSAAVNVPKMVRALQEGGEVALRPGESLTVQVTGMVVLGVSLGAYGVRGGVYGTYQGESAMTIKRIDAHTVEVVHAPKQERGLSINLDIMVVAEAFHNRSLAKACMMGHRFDLRHPEAREALRAALHGEAPFAPTGGLDIRDDEAARLAAHLRDGPQLPAGVTRTFVEKAERSLILTGVRVPKPFFLKWEPWGVNTAPLSGQSVLAYGIAALTGSVTGASRTWERGLKGACKVAQTTTLQRLHAFNAEGQELSRCDGVLVHLVVDQTYVSRSGLERAHRQWHRTFGHKVAPFQRSRSHESYAVHLRRHFTPGDLGSLTFVAEAAVNLVCVDHPDLAPALRELFAQLRVLRDLQPHFTHDTLVQGRAELVKHYLQNDSDGRRMAALHFLLGDDMAALDVTTDSSLVNEAQSRARRVAATWDADLPAAGTRARARALQQFDKAERRLDAAMKATNDDQVLRYYAQATFITRLDALGASRATVRRLRQQLLEA